MGGFLLRGSILNTKQANCIWQKNSVCKGPLKLLDFPTAATPCLLKQNERTLSFSEMRVEVFLKVGLWHRVQREGGGSAKQKMSSIQSCSAVVPDLERINRSQNQLTTSASIYLLLIFLGPGAILCVQAIFLAGRQVLSLPLLISFCNCQINI